MSSGAQAKRRPPPFKPPRPQQANSAVSKSAGKKKDGASTKIAKATTSKQAKAAAGKRRVSEVYSPEQPPQRRSRITISDDEVDDDEDAEEDSESEAHSMGDEVESDESPAASRRPAPSKPSNTELEENKPPPIPPKLLTRLLYESFEDKDMKIGREAMSVAGKYIETFVREAIARAAYEREDADKASGGAGDGFLQVMFSCWDSTIAS